MKTEVFSDAEAVARHAARWVASEARAAAADRPFTLAVSGGATPWKMLRALADEDVPWSRLHLFQVDERVAPAGDPDRNWTRVQEHLLGHAAIPESQLHPMPVEEPDLAAAAASYARTLVEVAGRPAALDLVHLGLGADGHTASLLPGDRVLEVADADVALTTNPDQGRRRMTLTYPVLDRASRILWLVTGASKRTMLRRLQAADPSVPAGRVRQARALVLADRAAEAAP